MSNDFKYIRSFNDICIGLQGDVSDCEYVFSLIDGYVRDLSLGHDNGGVRDTRGMCLTGKAMSHVCRNIVARRIRNRPLDVNGLVAGIICTYLYDQYSRTIFAGHCYTICLDHMLSMSLS